MQTEDDSDLICGITITATPRYPNKATEGRCRNAMWIAKEKVNENLKQILEGQGSQIMTNEIKRRLKNVTNFRIEAEVMGFEADDDNSEEAFNLELNVMGNPGELYDRMTSLLMDAAVGEAVCKTLQPLLSKYSEEIIPGMKIEWELEQTEYAE
jgi:uncharacterized protein YbcC (UPF0753/DUF2309 family)